ncbi:MAG: exosortase C-terminal domain/associated protein EpsI [Caulobacteraceae bacterium]
MIARRDMLIGAGCVLTAGAAWAMVPRRHVSLLGARDLGDIVPRAFGEWTSADTTDLVAPNEPGSLAATLYQSTIGRIYRQASTGAQLAMLIAHGDTQSDALQLHRPEICYPAFGFAIASSQALLTPVAAGVSIPSRVLVAKASGGQEVVLYWTRLGEFLPQSRREQQIDRLRTALNGEVGDGVLARFSIDTPDTAGATATMEGFAGALVRAMKSADRASLIGSARAEALRAV